MVNNRLDTRLVVKITEGNLTALERAVNDYNEGKPKHEHINIASLVRDSLSKTVHGFNKWEWNHKEKSLVKSQPLNIG